MIHGLFFCLAILIFGLPTAAAETLTVAVASNFSRTAQALASRYEETSGQPVRITTGSTGKLYAQIRNGAPYDALLAADQARPRRLEEAGLAVGGSRFTYAEGRLAVWTRDRNLSLAELASALTGTGVRSIAIANPELAPYGRASRQALQSLGIWEELRDRIVMGENVGQTYALVATGNATVGFVALSSVLDARHVGSHAGVRPELHAPIRQDAVLLRRGAGNDAATAFLAYLKTGRAREIIRRQGYDDG